MAFSELEKKRVEKVVAAYVEQNRPPVHLRKELDLAFRIKGQSVEIFEIRPVWNNPSKTLEEPVAKASYIRTQKVWKIYWQRADLKWHRYDPDPEVDSIEKFIAVVQRDEYCSFYG